MKSSIGEKLLLSIPPLLFLTGTLQFYFTEAIIGKITLGLVLEATANCLFNILYVIPLVLLKQLTKKWKAKRHSFLYHPVSNPVCSYALLGTKIF